MKKGSLVIVGSGIKSVAHVTLETKAHIEQSDQVFYVVGNPVISEWIKKLNSNTKSLYELYAVGKERLDTYDEMVEIMLVSVREGLKVCGIFYGHPGVFVNPSHRAIEQARKEGYETCMLPGVSAEDCLFADIGVDPAKYGCQSFEATDFLVYERKFDHRSSLILWQIGVIGDSTYQKNYDYLAGLSVLVEKLTEVYGADHEVIIYEAAEFPILEPVINRVPLHKLLESRVTPISTLYVPPGGPSVANPEMLIYLGIKH